MSNVQPNFLPTQKLDARCVISKLEAVEPEMKISIVRVKAQPRKHKAPPWAGVTWPLFCRGGKAIGHCHWLVSRETKKSVGWFGWFDFLGCLGGKEENMNR